MTDTPLADAEREEIEMLLPWYVTGKLDAHDRARVEAYLAANPEAARRLELVRAERAEAVAANEALGWPSPAATERIMGSLPAARPGLGALRMLRGGLQQLGGLFVAPATSAVRWAAVAAVLVIAVQTAAIATLVSQRPVGSYQTASGADGATGIALLVTFADDATATAISQLLAEMDAVIVDGPKAGGVYKIRLRTEDRSQPAREALVRKLAERRDVVRAVLPSRD
jgi:anti-sigma factor RsiW